MAPLCTYEIGTSEKLSIRNGGGKFPASVRTMQKVAPMVLTSTRMKVPWPFYKLKMKIISYIKDEYDEFVAI